MIAENDVMTLDESQRMNIGMRIQEQRIKAGMSGAMLGRIWELLPIRYPELRLVRRSVPWSIYL